MTKKMIFASVASIMLLAGCGSKQKVAEITSREGTVPIALETIPSGAKVYVDGKLVSTTTPTTINVPNMVRNIRNVNFTKKILQDKITKQEENTINIQIVKDGYEVVNDVVVPKVNLGELRFFWEFTWPENLIYELKERRAEVYEKDPTIPKGAANERVTRDTSGNTSLERTIIRWYFDSAPQGARIFWRVISSVPEEVKNTNELWLGSTPFEETRSFNIQGLTYENSRDVQIEIKVKRKGYIDQNKRFNVRQAIDQQEISSFFDMVEE